MSESIPLGTTLRVQGVGVVECDIWYEGLDSMLEHLAVGGGFLRHV